MTKVDDPPPPANLGDDRARSDDVGILFVHGIGEQAEWATLAQFGDPLISWATAWFEGHGGSTRTLAGVGHDDGPRHVHLEWSPADREPIRIVLAESWWAGRSAQPPLSHFLLWGPLMAYRTMGRFLTHIGIVILVLGAVAAVFLPDEALAVLFIVTLTIVAVAVVVPWVLILVAAVGRFLPGVKGPAKKLAAWLATVAGDAWVLLHSEVRFAAMRDKVAADAAWMSERTRTSLIVAHSQGSVVALEALVASPEVRCDTFITLGSALRLLKRRGVDPVKRLETVRPDLPWINIYAGLDPVSAGPIGRDQYPVELAVSNRMSLLFDHGSYPQNCEQVNALLVGYAGFLARGEPVYSDVEADQLLRASATRTMRIGARWATSLVVIWAGMGFSPAFRYEGWSRSVTESLTSQIDDVSGWIGHHFAHASSTATGEWTAAILVSSAAAMTYSAIVVRPIWAWFDKRCARRLACGSPHGRAPSPASVVSLVCLLPLGAASVYGIHRHPGWTDGYLILGVLITITTVVLVGLCLHGDPGPYAPEEMQRRRDALTSLEAHPLVPAFVHLWREPSAPEDLSLWEPVGPIGQALKRMAAPETNQDTSPTESR